MSQGATLLDTSDVSLAASTAYNASKQAQTRWLFLNSHHACDPAVEIMTINNINKLIIIFWFYIIA